MTTAAAIPHIPASGAHRSSGRLWPMLVVGLILLNATIVGITVYFATSDKSAATEPDYYAKALSYDQVIAQRQTNDRLGWHVGVSIQPGADGRTTQLVVSLTDRGGAPIAGAAIRATAFASVRSAQRQSLQLVALSPGQYAAPVRIDRSGQWNIRLSAVAGADTFTTETDLLIPDTLD